jgi:hypothetical protein
VQSYPIRRGHYKNIEGVRLKDMMEMAFGPVHEEEGKFVASYGALERIVAWADPKSLHVDTKANLNVDNDTAVRTRERWNAFLEQATGYTSKQRAKKIQEETKKGVPEVTE